MIDTNRLYPPPENGLGRGSGDGPLPKTLEFRPLPGSRWQVMSPVSVRSTGLPARLLTELSGSAGADLDADLVRSATTLIAIGRMNRFREALAWQNPGVLSTIDSLARSAPDGKRNSKRRDREYRLQRYVARYSGKTETIGFFGPSGWATVVPGPGHVQQRPGPDMIGRRCTFAEPWSVRAVAAALAEDEAIAAWLPVRLRTHYAVRRDHLIRPRQAPVPLSEQEVTVLVLCDGVRPRCEIVAAAAAKLEIDQTEVDECLSAMLRSRYLVSDANLPFGPDCVMALEQRLDVITDRQVAATARATVAPYLDALRALGQAHGDADAVVAAQRRLADAFEEITGKASARRSGRMYAGRGIAYEDCVRDTTVEIGAAFLDRIAGLAPILDICQWVTCETATAYREYFVDAWRGRGEVTLDAVWFDIVAAFFGSKPKPIDGVERELQRRWGQLVSELQATSGSWDFDAADFRRAVDDLFPSTGPGWPLAAVHSPDLQLVAHSPNGTETGDYTVVLSEIHLGAATISGPVFEWPFDGYQVSQQVRSRLGTGYLPVFPETWPRNTGRTLAALALPSDVQYAFADTEGAASHTISIADIRLRVVNDTVVASLPDGTEVGFEDFFGLFLTAVVVDAWKHVTTGGYTPRVSVGGMVVAREAWRVDVSAESFAHPSSERAAYAAAREWQARLGLPDQIYIKLAGEMKPFFTDLGSPISTLSFLAALRAALRDQHRSTMIGISEALPGPEQAWVVDSDGERYLGELRMVFMHQAD